MCQDPAHDNHAELYSQSKDIAKYGVYTKPQYTEQIKVEAESYKCRRRSSLINYGHIKHEHETRSLRNSKLVEETTEESEIIL